MQCNVLRANSFLAGNIYIFFLYLVHTTYFEAWELEGNLILQYCNSI